MNKTRMGKRVASLLLSLVMMLSLLPTAAYATMADDVDTQGASVSENGTGVSDDDNSGGDTGDQQVVGGSANGGTADDTTGAEGDADPTDSVNGNDSADPQDDEGAAMPVASNVVSTSEELVAAITAANDGDTITLGEGEFTTYGNTSPKKSLTFVGAGDKTVWIIGDLSKDVKSEGNGDCSFDGCETITFQNMTLKSDGADYRGFIRISNTVVKKCTLVGKTAYWGYETAKFEDSTFNAPVGDYALWDYSTKAMTLEGCTFNISGKGVNVYVEQPSTDARTVEVNSCTVNSTKAGKAFLNIENSTQAYDVTLSGTNTVTGLEANGTTGSALYQVETTKVTETTGNPVTVKQQNTAGEFETVYEVKQPSANVAKVGDTEYATLEAAIAALSSSSYTLELLDETAWNAATPVYWAAGTQSGYAATLADALTAAYMANAGGITIVCRPGADVGKLTHGHVADDITIYGNNAYISSGECELEVDTYMFSRETGKQATTGGAYLEKDITVTAYELDNLGVWGQRHTDHKVTVNLTDCDSVHGITVQRVYISGTTGVNDITLTGCDFGTKATSVYSNADGKVVIDNCSFTGAQVPVNFNHKANGTQTVTVKNSAFTNCGDNGDWKQFAAPVRFVNSGSGTMTTSVNTCTFTDTVGGNGDILLGDGRVGEKSNDVKLTVENTAANVQAQQPGYYAKDGTTDESKQGTKNVAASDTLTTSVTQLTTSSETTYVAAVGEKKYKSLQAAIDAATEKATVILLADAAEDVAISKNITLDLGGKTLTNTNTGKATISVTGGTVTVKNGNVVGGTGYYNIEVTKGSNANLTLTDVTATAGNTGSSMIDNWGTLTITSGTYTGGLNVVKSEEGSVLNISGGTFTRKTAPRFGITGTVLVYGTTTITGGTFNEKSTSTNARVVVTGRVKGYDSITYVKGGTFNGNGNNVFHHLSPAQADDSFEVSGGTFNKSIPDYYCADGFIPTKNAGGTYGVKEGQYVAKVGSKKYETLADAIRLAAKGQTITLLADVEQNTQLTINKSITLDLNGKTIKNTMDIWGDNANAILSIKKGANVTITGNGTIDAKENDCYTINVVKGDLTIENGTFYGNVSVVQMEEGTLSVKGGTFDLHQKWEGSSKYLFNCIDKAYVGGSANVAISGGTFVGFDPNVSPEQKVDGKTPSFAAPGVGITRNADGSFTAAAGMTAQILDKDGNSVNAYNTLAEAVAAAEDGQTVRLLADVTLDAQIATGKAITIDGQSKYTIKTVKKLVSTDGKAGMFYRTQSAKGTLTFLNVTLDGGSVSKIFLNEGGAGETVFDGVTSTNGGGIAYGSGIHISGGGSHATIRNSTLTGSTGTKELNDTNYYAANDLWVGGNVYVTVENSVIGTVFVNSAPTATATNGVVHGQLTITGESTKITYLSGEEESADKLDKFGNNGSLVKIDSGYVEKVFDMGSYAISGGTFKTEVKKEWCAAGYVPADNGNGTYGVAVGMFTVKVTSRTTGSDSPVANVAGGGSDITYAEGITVTASAISGYNFVGWFVNEYTGTPYSTNLTCEVKPTDDWTMIAVYEPISGGKFWLTVTASEFTVNGGAVQDSYLYEQFAVGASVTVNFTGSENFLYWVNASNKVVSTEKSYTFIMGSETTLKAVYGKARQNQATVVFISHSDQIISSKAYTTSDTIQFPVPPIKMGCTFTGWSMTEAEIRAAMANNSGIIQVRARYTEPSIACTVTVVYPEGTDNQVVNAVVGKAIDVTAKDIEGKTFSYWTDDKGTVLGYTKTLKLAPSGDMTVKAVYDENAEVKPVISMTAIDASAGNGYWVVSFTATRAVPAGYEMVKQGILYSLDSRCAGEAGKDYLKLTADGTVPEGVYEYSGKDQALNGVTRFNGKVGTAETTLYGRGYMILKNSAGKVLNVYADTILSGSYNSVNK